MDTQNGWDTAHLEVPMSRRTFTREFKVEAVRLVDEERRTIASVARDLGIGAGLLSRWRKQLGEGGEESFPGKGRLKPSEEEVRKLQRRLREVEQENEFLKKTAAYFARQNGRGSR